MSTAWQSTSALFLDGVDDRGTQHGLVQRLARERDKIHSRRRGADRPNSTAVSMSSSRSIRLDAIAAVEVAMQAVR